MQGLVGGVDKFLDYIEGVVHRWSAYLASILLAMYKEKTKTTYV